jgi:hypothetical protein
MPQLPGVQKSLQTWLDPHRNPPLTQSAGPLRSASGEGGVNHETHDTHAVYITQAHL